MVENHGYLQMFYNSRLPYTEEFEQMYNIVKEVAGKKADNTIVLGRTFNALKNYNQASAKDPQLIYRTNALVAILRQPPPRQPSMLAVITPQQLVVYRAIPESVRRAMTADLRSSRFKDMVE